MTNQVQVKMLKTAKGSENGIEVLTFEAGQTYKISADLAHAFMSDASCELCDCAECPAETKIESVKETAIEAPAEEAVESVEETSIDAPLETKAE